MKKDYKIIPGLARGAVIVVAVLTILSVRAHAGREESRLARAALAQVESVAASSRKLEILGKSTFREAALILDLGEAAIPSLSRVLINQGKDWKLRYWVVDMLGYVGDIRTMSTLLGLVENRKERVRIRMRALDSIAGIASRHGSASLELKEELEDLKKKVRDRRVRKKVKETLKRIARGVKNQSG